MKIFLTARRDLIYVFPLSEDDFLEDHFFRLGFAGVHDADPLHLIGCLERFRGSLSLDQRGYNCFQPALGGVLRLIL